MRRRIGFIGLVFATLAACSDAGRLTDESSNEVASSARGVAVPSYRVFRLEARSTNNAWSDEGAYAVPAGSALQNLTPSLDDRGNAVIDYSDFDGFHHVAMNGKILYDVPDRSGVVANTSIDESGDVVFDVMGALSGNGIWMYHADTGATTFVTSDPLGADSWLRVKQTNGGRVGCRTGSGDRHFIGLAHPDGFDRLAVDVRTNPSSPYSYLFAPAFDARGRAAAKVELVASGGNEIRIFEIGVPVRVVVGANEFAKLDNGVAFNEAGQVAFVGTAGGSRGVYRRDRDATTKIAAEGEGDVARIAVFTVAMNGSGLVVFKGDDRDGRNAVWVGNGVTLTKVVAAGSTLPTDRGDAVAQPDTTLDPNNRVAFGGGLAINTRGDIAFLATLAQLDGDRTRRLGTAVYTARAE